MKSNMGVSINYFIFKGAMIGFHIPCYKKLAFTFVVTALFTEGEKQRQARDVLTKIANDTSVKVGDVEVEARA